MIKLMGKKIITILRSKYLLNWTYDSSAQIDIQLYLIAWEILQAFLSSADFFSEGLKQNLSGKTTRKENSLDPDQARPFLASDLVQNVCKVINRLY